MKRNSKPRILRIKQDAKEFLPDHLQHLVPHANWLQHKIILFRSLKITRKRNPSFVRLKWDYLAKELGKQATSELLGYLIKNGIIERTSNYHQGVASFGYRLSQQLRTRQTVEWLLTDQKLLKRLHKSEAVAFKRGDEPYRHLRRWLKRITIDINGAKKTLLTLDPETRECVMEVVSAIDRGDMHPSVCEYGRFHSAITHLKREMRQHLRVNGQPMVNIDIANSQPLFLAIELTSAMTPYPQTTMLNQPSEQQHETGGGRLPPLPPVGTPEVPSHTSGPLPTRVPSIRLRNAQENDDKSLTSKVLRSNRTPTKNPQALPRDVQYFMELCQRGELYPYLMDGMGWQGHKSEWKKDVWFKFFYGPYRSLKQLHKPEHLAILPLARFFRKEFPTVYKLLKRRKKGDYKRLPCAMQRRESSLMIRTVIQRLAQEHPEVPVVTIHDSILTTREHVELVKNYIRDAFQSFGVHPLLREEEYPQEVNSQAA